ncbi:HD domain-containing protein [Burkholderia sp. R-70199]|nr:HD domain-containing protein [Burkholderia sp. R-70199]
MSEAQNSWWPASRRCAAGPHVLRQYRALPAPHYRAAWIRPIHLRLLKGDFGGFPVDRLTHSLQTATLAHRDSQDEEYVVCALLHDIGDTLGSYNHADVAAVLLEPFVSAENHWMVKHHGVFQGYYFFHHMGMDRNLRDNYRDVPELFKRTAHFCEKYDAAAFDPDAETLPLAFFEPMVRRVFAEPKRTLYKAAFEKIG